MRPLPFLCRERERERERERKGEGICESRYNSQMLRELCALLRESKRERERKCYDCCLRGLVGERERETTTSFYLITLGVEGLQRGQGENEEDIRVKRVCVQKRESVQAGVRVRV